MNPVKDGGYGHIRSGFVGWNQHNPGFRYPKCDEKPDLAARKLTRKSAVRPVEYPHRKPLDQSVVVLPIHSPEPANTFDPRSVARATKAVAKVLARLSNPRVRRQLVRI